MVAGYALAVRGQIWSTEGKHREALALLRDAVNTSHDKGDVPMIVTVFGYGIQILVGAGAPEIAALCIAFAVRGAAMAVDEAVATIVGAIDAFVAREQDVVEDTSLTSEVGRDRRRHAAVAAAPGGSGSVHADDERCAAGVGGLGPRSTVAGRRRLRTREADPEQERAAHDEAGEAELAKSSVHGCSSLARAAQGARPATLDLTARLRQDLLPELELPHLAVGGERQLGGDFPLLGHLVRGQPLP